MANFSDIMTAWLAQTALTEYFPSIVRRRVEPAKWTKALPLLAVYVTDNLRDDDSGDGNASEVANYTIVAAAKLAAGESQDVRLAEMAALLQQAAKGFVYANVSGISADAKLAAWTSDEAAGDQPGSVVWLEAPLRLEY